MSHPSEHNMVFQNAVRTLHSFSASAPHTARLDRYFVYVTFQGGALAVIVRKSVAEHGSYKNKMSAPETDPHRSTERCH